MKNTISFAKFAFFVSMIIVSLLAVSIASDIYHYEVMVKGILGFFVIYLMFRVFWSSKIEELDPKRLTLSEKIRYFVFIFIYSIVAYWALIQLLEMVIFLMGLII